ncbi:MAG: acetyl-CoA carboxylase biotin carboxyl carrier protein subunit [Bryobacteraceae bacterium]
MKLRVDVDGEDFSLDLSLRDGEAAYRLQEVKEAANSASGSASIIETQTGVYSVLLGYRSFEVRIANTGKGPAEVWVRNRRYLISQGNPRDSATRQKGAAAQGPREIRAQMPGKVISILVATGDPVQTGQGLIIVEAMKMQNEMRSPNDGIVSKIKTAAGATVAQGDVLMVVDSTQN